MLRPASLAVLLAVIPGSARAESPALKRAVASALRRARRSFAVGIYAGGAVAYLPTPGKREYPISVGLGVDVFKIKIVPDMALVKQLATERVKAKVMEHVLEIVQSGGVVPPQEELEAMGRAMGEDVAAEVLDELSARPRTLETPRLSVGLEGAYLPVAKAWQLRVTTGFGLSLVTLGPTVALDVSRPRGLLLGGELAVHLMPSSGPRSPVIDFYLRGDAGVTSATRHQSQIVLGTRLLFDFL